MKTRIQTKISSKRIPGITINWDDAFDTTTHHREQTIEFAQGNLNGKEWVDTLYLESAKKAARRLINRFGVKGTRQRAKRWVKPFIN